jgi:hypothetical protein
MGHELIPRSGPLPPAREVARLLAAEVAVVRTDAEEGMKRAQSLAVWIERSPASIFLGHHREALERAAMLKRLGHGDALAIDFGDSPDAAKRIVVIPGESIKFGYESAEDEGASRDLVERCARVLHCDVVLF